jgi:hypothetical protein
MLWSQRTCLGLYTTLNSFKYNEDIIFQEIFNNVNILENCSLCKINKLKYKEIDISYKIGCFRLIKWLYDQLFIYFHTYLQKQWIINQFSFHSCKGKN